METSRTVSPPSDLSQTPQEAPHELVESTQKRSKVELPQEKKDEEGEIHIYKYFPFVIIHACIIFLFS